MNKILSIIHKMQKYLNDGVEGGDVFSNILNGFDKVWYKGYLHK